MIKNQSKKDLSAIMVIFGGTGDLTHRKLMPALYNLVYDKLLPERFAVVSIGRKEKTSELYREEVFKSLNERSRNKINPEYWNKLKNLIYYLHDLQISKGMKSLESAWRN